MSTEKLGSLIHLPTEATSVSIYRCNSILQIAIRIPSQSRSLLLSEYLAYDGERRSKIETFVAPELLWVSSHYPLRIDFDYATMSNVRVVLQPPTSGAGEYLYEMQGSKARAYLSPHVSSDGKICLQYGGKTLRECFYYFWNSSVRYYAPGRLEERTQIRDSLGLSYKVHEYPDNGPPKFDNFCEEFAAINGKSTRDFEDINGAFPNGFPITEFAKSGKHDAIFVSHNPELSSEFPTDSCELEWFSARIYPPPRMFIAFADRVGDTWNLQSAVTGTKLNIPATSIISKKDLVAN